MKFGQVEDPGNIDFSLPNDHPDTEKLLQDNKESKPFVVYVGCAKWNKADLKNFYPRGTKDELTYYSSQFNSIELNATFYNMPSSQQVGIWKNKTPDDFKFFPKITNSISHYKRLIDVSPVVEMYCDAISVFEEKLGMAFLQMHDNFKPKDFSRVEKFVEGFPRAIPLAIELRNEDWFKQQEASEKIYHLLEANQATNIIVDTAGRRDMLHMRLTTPYAFVRYVGANHESDYKRLDEWVERIRIWREMGLKELYFFVHQNIEKESPLLSAYFIEKINEVFNVGMKVPDTLKS